MSESRNEEAEVIAIAIQEEEKRQERRGEEGRKIKGKVEPGKPQRQASLERLMYPFWVARMRVSWQAQGGGW